MLQSGRYVQHIEREESQNILKEILPQINDKTWEYNVDQWLKIFSGEYKVDFLNQELVTNWETIIKIAKALVFVRILFYPPQDRNHNSSVIEKINLYKEKERALNFCEQAGKFFGIEISASLHDPYERQIAYATKLAQISRRNTEIIEQINNGTWQQQVESWQTIFSGKKVDEATKNELLNNWHATREIARVLIWERSLIFATQNPIFSSIDFAQERKRALIFCEQACNYFNFTNPNNSLDEFEQQCAYVAKLPSHNKEIFELYLLSLIRNKTWQKQITLWQNICSGNALLTHSNLVQLRESWKTLRTIANTLIFNPSAFASATDITLLAEKEKALKFCEEVGKFLGITLQDELDDDLDSEKKLMSKQLTYAAKLPENFPEKNPSLEVASIIAEYWNDLERWERIFDGSDVNLVNLETLERNWEKISQAINFLTSLDCPAIFLEQKKQSQEFLIKANKFFGFSATAEVGAKLPPLPPENAFFKVFKLIKDNTWQTQKTLWENLLTNDKLLDKEYCEKLIAGWDNIQKVATTINSMKLPEIIDHKTLLHNTQEETKAFHKQVNTFFQLNPEEPFPNKDKIQKLLSIKLITARKEKLLSGWITTSGAKEKAALLTTLIDKIGSAKTINTAIAEWENSQVGNKNRTAIVIGQHRWSIFSHEKTKTELVIDNIKSLAKSVSPH
jgi:hypothetical protein